MQEIELDLFDKKRNRAVPTMVYMPDSHTGELPVVIFGPGYQAQEELAEPNAKYFNRSYTYLADYFTSNGYAFIAIQHEVLGDEDGLEVIDPKAPQHEARKHLYERGVQNILFAIDELKKQNLPLNFEKLIVSGHSNGGDISKHFATLHTHKTSTIIVFEARRCRLEPSQPVKLLMFEADDTSTDPGVLPLQNQTDNSMRANIEWVVIKPRGALHVSYMDEDVTNYIKATVCSALDWFLARL